MNTHFLPQTREHFRNNEHLEEGGFLGDFLYFECSKLIPLDGTFETPGISVKSQVSARHRTMFILSWDGKVQVK